MIILEGPDNSGKSTLARELANLTRYLVIHPGGAPIDAAHEIQCMEEQFKQSGLNVIHDRVTCISQPVYNTMRNTSGPSIGTCKHIFKLLNHRHNLIIYCRPPNEIVLSMQNHVVKSHDSPEHIKLVEANQEKLVASYDLLFSLVPHIKYDYTIDSAEDLAKLLLKLLSDSKAMYYFRESYYD